MKPIGLTVAALLCAMTMSLALAGAAAAETSEWMKGGRTFSELSVTEEKVTTSSGPVSIKLPSLKAEIVCTEVTGEGKFLQGGSIELTTTLKACKSGFKACTLKEPVVLKTKSELILVGGGYYDKVAAKEKNIATLSFSGKECALPPEAALTGEFPAAISLEESEKPPMNFSEGLTKTVDEALKKESKSELNLFFGPLKQIAYLGGEFLLVPPPPPDLPRRVPFTKLCPFSPGNGVCPGGEIYEMGTMLEIVNSSHSFFTYGANEIDCQESEIKGTTGADSGAPLPVAMTTLNFGVECGEETECGAEKTVGTTFSIWRLTTSPFYASNGLLSIPGLALKLDCFGMDCFYDSPEVRFSINSGTTMKGGPFTLGSRIESEPGCPATARWAGPMGPVEYTIAVPSPLYQTG